MSPSNSEFCVIETKQWINKIVLGLNLCPFAHLPFNEDKIRYKVLSPDRAVIEQINEEIKILIHAPTHEMETTLIIMKDEVDFLPYLSLIEQIEILITNNELDGIIQVASFHPDYQFQGLSIEDVRNYTNRSPYAMVHLLREESVTQAVLRHGNTDQIPIDNQSRLRSIGVKGIKKLLKS